MRSQTQIIDELLRTWMGEFGRAVEMFNGEQPELSSKRSQLLPTDEVNSLLWMKHVFSSKGDFATWIGAKEATWRVLGGSLGGGDPEILRTYSEMLNQAQQGTANVLSTELGRSVYCKQGEFLSAPDFDQAQVAIFSLGMAAGKPPSVFWAVELASADILEAHEADPAPAPKANGEQGAAAVSLMDRLLDLQLPVSVALGRANLPIKKS